MLDMIVVLFYLINLHNPNPKKHAVRHILQLDNNSILTFHFKLYDTVYW